MQKIESKRTRQKLLSPSKRGKDKENVKSPYIVVTGTSFFSTPPVRPTFSSFSSSFISTSPPPPAAVLPGLASRGPSEVTPVFGSRRGLLRFGVFPAAPLKFLQKGYSLLFFLLLYLFIFQPLNAPNARCGTYYYWILTL